jgi:hypothetical protein
VTKPGKHGLIKFRKYLNGFEGSGSTVIGFLCFANPLVIGVTLFLDLPILRTARAAFLGV